jgi:undecaprenyl diphosphate synthase
MLKDEPLNELNHLAIIMDGNGRWAKNRGLPRVKGHEKGAKTVKDITTYAAKNGIKRLTLYAFSTENWTRPKSEIDFLMNLLEHFIKKEHKTLLDNNIRFETIGDLTPLSSNLQNALTKLKNDTLSCTGMTQVIALNYGSKDEIMRAIKTIAKGELTLQNFESALDNAIPVDLLIRTGGQMRLSNFLLWQAAYAELRFSPTLWPEFTCLELEELIKSFHSTQRRFGGLDD